jgi:hypothetical protein
VTEAEYNIGMARAYELIMRDPELDSPDGIELNKLVTELEAYERSMKFCQWDDDHGLPAGPIC